MISGAEQFYGEELAATLLSHLRANYLFSSPDALVMGRAVNHTAALEVLRNPEWQFPRDQQTAWWLQWLEGDWRSLVRHFPYPLPFICYERRGKLRVRAWDAFNPSPPSVPVSHGLPGSFVVLPAPPVHS